MWWHALIAVGILVSAIQAIRSHRLLISAIWLAGTSALVALEMYLLGAPELGVIELSVGAGLVTVLFVFAINIAGEEPLPDRSRLPKPLAWLVVGGALVLLGWLNLPNLVGVFPESVPSEFQVVLWENRSLDTLLQVLLIFAGVLGMLGLLSNGKTHAEPPEAGQ